MIKEEREDLPGFEVTEKNTLDTRSGHTFMPVETSATRGEYAEYVARSVSSEIFRKTCGKDMDDVLIKASDAQRSMCFGWSGLASIRKIVPSTKTVMIQGSRTVKNDFISFAGWALESLHRLPRASCGVCAGCSRTRT